MRNESYALNNIEITMTNKSNWFENPCLYDDDISEMYCEYSG